MEWSLAPSIFNIKAQGLTHCLYWMNLSRHKVYDVYFNVLHLILLSCKKIISSMVFFHDPPSYPHRNSTAATAAAAASTVVVATEEKEASIWLIVVFHLAY